MKSLEFQSVRCYQLRIFSFTLKFFIFSFTFFPKRYYPSRFHKFSYNFSRERKLYFDLQPCLKLKYSPQSVQIPRISKCSMLPTMYVFSHSRRNFSFFLSRSFRSDIIHLDFINSPTISPEKENYILICNRV